MMIGMQIQALYLHPLGTVYVIIKWENFELGLLSKFHKSNKKSINLARKEISINL